MTKKRLKNSCSQKDTHSDQPIVKNSLLVDMYDRKTVKKSVSAQPEILNAIQMATLDAYLGQSHSPTSDTKIFLFFSRPIGHYP
jgi:hypothetical protein